MCFEPCASYKHVHVTIPFQEALTTDISHVLCSICHTCVSACANAEPDDHTACEAARRRLLHISTTQISGAVAIYAVAVDQFIRLRPDQGAEGSGPNHHVDAQLLLLQLQGRFRCTECVSNE